MHLLPNYDEYLIAYKDRGAVVETSRAANLVARSNGGFAHHLIIDGRLAGGWRRTLQGQHMAPAWEHTAAALSRGAFGDEHVEVIRKCLKRVPGWVDATTRADVERDLADWARGMPPQDLEVAANYLLNAIDPDGA